MDRDYDRTRSIPLSNREKWRVFCCLCQFIEDYFDFLNDIVKDDDDIVKENELFEE